MIIIPVQLEKNDFLNSEIEIPTKAETIKVLIGSAICGLIWFFCVMIHLSDYRSVGWALGTSFVAWLLGLYTFLIVDYFH